MADNLNVYVTSRRELKPDELSYLRRLAKVLNAIPETLTLGTIGDGLMVWDTEVERELTEAGLDVSDGAVSRAGGSMAYIPHPIVHGVSG